MTTTDSALCGALKTLCLTFMLACAGFANAHTVSGIVTDQNSTGLKNAKVVHLGSTDTVYTDGLGEFILTDVHLGDSLQIETIGYETAIFYLDKEEFFRPDYQFTVFESVTQLSEVIVTGNQELISETANIDLTLQPVRSSQELLTLVPGLFIAQHAGGGKAEQLFLRGFDIDHGTDVALSVDGMPVNMVSHAHGQGYSDMHFIMPEVIEKIDFAKGPYDVQHGNFATAGHVDFRTKDRLERNSVAVEYGMFNHKKITSTIKLLDNKHGQNAYFAADYMLTDNYFDSPQDFNRINLFAKYSGIVSPNFRLNASVSMFQSAWNASGQIPERAVQSGQISRFGAIDDTEGGQTGRTNVQLGLINRLPGNATLRSNFFVSGYDFTLFSNFTFFLEDSINGDQIRQSEKRRIYGGKTEWEKHWLSGSGNVKFGLTGGTGFRYDDINDIELAATSNRKTVRNQIQRGNVDETNLFAYVQGQLEVGKFDFMLGLRGDNFNFYYENLLDTVYSPRSLSQSVLLPKLSIVHNTSEKLQLFLKSGIGYHSNDTRVVLAADNLDRKVLPLAYGSDIGFAVKPVRSLLINVAGWYLLSEQEFVYVGDAGIVEPGGRSQRTGFDLGATWQPLNWLFLYSNLNYAHARALGEPEGADRIPLAPVWTSNGKVQVNLNGGIFASLSYRYMGDRAANEDNSVVAKGYFVNDLTVGYQRNSFVITGIVQNVLNVEWNETQFLTESRLQNELQSVEEIHFTPGTPFNARLQLKFLF
jgi:hypothetical protein